MSAIAGVPADEATAAAVKEHANKPGLSGYLLFLPGGLWLVLFFFVPVIILFRTALSDPSGNVVSGYDFTWAWGNFSDAVSSYWPHLWRSLVYAVITTGVCIVVGYPLAYAIAFKVGRWSNLVLVLVVAPFFTSFLLRTLSWKLLLGDHSWFTETLRTVGLLSDHGRLLATPFAVVAGLVYNFLPLMVLPLYASLSKIDPRLHEAGADLYGSPRAVLRKVTIPLSMPGIVSGTLLTFIPATGDYINSSLLGSTTTRMIGNDIEALFKTGNYPIASALSTILMVTILIIVLIYVRRAGTDKLL